MRLASLGILLAALLVGSAASAQDLGEVAVFGGIQFGGSIDVEDDSSSASGSANIEAGPSFGGLVAYRVNPDALVVLSYHQQRTKIDVTLNGTQPISGDFDASLGFLHFGGEVEVDTVYRFVPFFGLTVGATHVSPDAAGANTHWYFSGQLYGGAKIPITERLGIRAQLGLLTTVVHNDSAWVCGSVQGRGGCLVSADIGAAFQGNFTGGIYYQF